MRIGILTNEYPPHVYGGAGVHVEYLTRELAALDGGRHQVRIICFGDQRVTAPSLTVEGVEPPVDASGAGPAARQVLRDDAAGPDDGGEDVRRRRRALPHVVHPLRGLPREATAAGAARPDDALARAAPPVEGRATGHGVPRVELDREDGVRERRRRRRGVERDEGRRPGALRRGPRAREGDPQRDRPRAVPADAGSRGAGRVRDRPGRAVRAVRRPDHAAEGHHPPRQRHRARAAGHAGGAVRGRAGHAGDREGDGGGGGARAGAQREPDRLDSRRCCRRRR